MKKSLISLVTSTAVLVITVSSAIAQQVDENGNVLPAGGNAPTTERVIVTGSNIPTAEEVGPNPVVILNRDTFDKSGESTTEQFLRDQPVASVNGVPISNNENGSNTAVGAATIALRGFDSRATLILIDGRRVAPYPTGNNPGLVNAMFVDLNSIPAAAIESIEILKDGASTTFGADAVAGVVNIKMRHYYDGAESRVQYGNTLDDDSGEYISSITFGVGNKTTEIAGVLNYYHRNSIANRDRSFSAVPPFLSSNASPYNLVLSKAVVAAAGGTVVPGPETTEFATPPDFTTGSAPASAYLYDSSRIRAAGGLRPGFNFNQFSLSFPETERYGGYFHAEHKIFEDQMVAYGDLMYQNVKTHNELAGPATGSFQTKGQTILAIPPHMSLGGVSPPDTPGYGETGMPANAFNPFNPFNQIISGGTRARLQEFGNRLFDNETDAFLSTLGVKGEKLFDGNWGYDAAFRYSQLKNIQTGRQVSASLFNRILNQADPIFDPASPQFIGTTTAFNPFGDYRVPIPSNAATLAFATVHPKDEDISKLATLDATIYTTSLFSLPAGGISMALGGQFRRENLEENPDRLNVAGDIVGNSPVPSVRGGRKSYAFYLETDIPIFSSANAITGFHALSITAASRFEAFRNNDTNVVVPKFGLRWQPFNEELTVRATWGEGFREPSLEELFSAPISTLQVSHDINPITHQAVFESETNTLIVSNPNLQPEDSRSFSGGFVYTPKFVPGLNLSIDFWDIERTGVVAAPTVDQVLVRERMGALFPGEVVERDSGGFITRIILANQNLGSQEARGIDFGLLYQKPTPWGTFTWLTNVTYLDSFTFPQFEPGNLAGLTTDEGSSNEGWYKWKADSRLDWAWKGFDFVVIGRYIDGFDEHNPDLVHHYVHPTYRWDLQASYDFTTLVPVENKPVAGYSKAEKETTAPAAVADSSPSAWTWLLKGTVLTIGCNNVFDQDPPFASGEGGNAVGYPGFTYDATGRFVYMRLTKKF